MCNSVVRALCMSSCRVVVTIRNFSWSRGGERVSDLQQSIDYATFTDGDSIFLAHREAVTVANSIVRYDRSNFAGETMID